MFIAVNSIAVRGVPHYGIIAGAVQRAGTYRAVAAALVLNALAPVALNVPRIGLYFGLPFNYGVDEPAVVARAWQMLATGDSNPHFFHYPSLGFYMTEAALLLGFLREAAAGTYGALADVPEYVP